MLDIALQFLKDELNTYLLTRTGSSTVSVKLTGIVDDAGKYAFGGETIGATVLNIEEERAFKSQLPEYSYLNGRHVIAEPAIRLNLHILFAANFKQYDEALKFISYILTFFQARPHFSPDAYPGLNPAIEKLVVELQSLNYEQLNQIWAFIGGKQLPSVVYKVRMIALQDQVRTAVQPPLTVIGTDILSR
ncbi:DUF4255 domain-containing protein [Methylocaldum sp. MU1018]